MLEFYYDFLDYYLHHEDFEILEVDMGSNYLGISAENLEDLINPELSKEFDRNKRNWFVTPHAPQGKRTPGLFIVEFKGFKMVDLCSKSYCTELLATENSPAKVKFSMKGVNKGQFKNPMPHYKHVLTTQQNVRARNQGIRAKDESVVMYKQDKNALTYFCQNEKYLLMDARLYLWTFKNFIYEHSIRQAHGLCI